MDQLILLHKPNKILENEMMMNHSIPQTKHPISYLHGKSFWQIPDALVFKASEKGTYNLFISKGSEFNYFIY